MKFTSVLAASAASAAPVQWTVAEGGNDHWYEIVTGTTYSVWADAVSDASTRTFHDLQGYLATITSEAEQTFLNGLYNGGNGPLWLGGSDEAVEGTWEWVTEPGGPIAFSYTNWANGEPNNYYGIEDHIHGWWSGSAWNDIYDGAGNYGFVVEYSEYSVPTVPVPATLPLLAAGLAGLAALRRRKKA